MNVEVQVERLQALLTKVRFNSAALAASRAAGGEPASAPTEPQAVAGDQLHAPAPAVQAASNSVAPASLAPATQQVALSAEPTEAPPVLMPSAPPPSALDVGEEDLVTIPPAASEQSLSMPPARGEMQSGLQVVPDVTAATEPAEEPELEVEVDFSENIADEVTGERAALTHPSGAPFSTAAGEPDDERVTGSPDANEVRPEAAEAGDISVRTPPPESGPQVSLPPGAGFAPDSVSGYEEQGIPERRSAPTMAQLGSTVDLDAGEGALELHVEVPPRRSTLPPVVEEELEVAIPSRRFAGTYDAALAPPASALEDLSAHDRAERERSQRLSSMPAPEALYSQPPAAPLPSDVPAAAARISSVPPVEHPAVFERPPVLAAISPAVYETREPTRARSFLELLDRSLSLRQP